jgi:hypothetical protein
VHYEMPQPAVILNKSLRNTVNYVIVWWSFAVQVRQKGTTMRQLNLVFVLSVLLPIGCAAQEAPTATAQTGFVSPDKYTNAFFGFSLPLPQDPTLHKFALPPNFHSVFGLQAQTNGVTTFAVFAKETNGASSKLARKAAAGPKEERTKKIEIDGREFWRSESRQESRAGRMRTINYATAINGYLLSFQIVSFDEKLTDALQQCIESVKFFDPTKAPEMAGPNSRPYSN